jgi:hypothetical protein
VDTPLHAVGVEAAPTEAASGLGPLALWHLLSLDAPTVAALWTWFVARSLHIALPWTLPLAMFLAVWLLYAADRLLDVRAPTNSRHSERSEFPAIRPSKADRSDARYPSEPRYLARSTQKLEARHLFHSRHRTRFLAAICAVTLALLPLLPAIPRRTLHLYLILAALLLVWFALIHLAPICKPLPKELLPGPFFATAIFLPSLSAGALPLALAAALFALLCIANCLFIYAWEHPSQTGGAHPATQFGLRAVRPLTLANAACALALCPFAPEFAPILIAIAAASALLFGLDRLRGHLDPTDLRAAADLVLLTPLLVAPWVR